MGLNKSTGNMYDFVTHTWNTVKGACHHGCSYCYMKRWGQQRPIRFDEAELKTDLGSGNFIFVGSSNDLFAADIPCNWIGRTLHHCAIYDNRYLFQSKNPGKMWTFALPEKSVVCTTIETNRWYPEIMQNAPAPQQRARDMTFFGIPRFVTIEPIMDFDLAELVALIRLVAPEQVNIGADSGGNHLPEPSAEKVAALIAELGTFTRIARKTNLARLMKG